MEFSVDRCKVTCVGTNFLRFNTTWRWLSSTESAELKCSFRMPVLLCHKNTREDNRGTGFGHVLVQSGPAPDLPFWEQRCSALFVFLHWSSQVLQDVSQPWVFSRACLCATLSSGVLSCQEYPKWAALPHCCAIWDTVCHLGDKELTEPLCVTEIIA